MISKLNFFKCLDSIEQSKHSASFICIFSIGMALKTTLYSLKTVHILCLQNSAHLIHFLSIKKFAHVAI